MNKISRMNGMLSFNLFQCPFVLFCCIMLIFPSNSYVNSFYFMKSLPSTLFSSILSKYKPTILTNLDLTVSIAKTKDLPTNNLILQEKAMEFIPIESMDWKVLSDIWDSLAKLIPNQIMLYDPIHRSLSIETMQTTDISMSNDTIIRKPSKEITIGQNITYKDFQTLITIGANQLRNGKFGMIELKETDCIAIFAENSYRWLIMEQTILKAGAYNAVRGSSAPISELTYILEHSQSVGLVVESLSLLNQLLDYNLSSSNSNTADYISTLKFVIVLYSNMNEDKDRVTLNEIRKKTSVPILTYEDIYSTNNNMESSMENRNGERLATIIYTSGTTNKPKGVMLTHHNLISQIKDSSFSNIPIGKHNQYDPKVGDVFLSILPCWHIFERTAEYYCLSRGSQMIYSNLKNFKSDLQRYRPHYLIAVPRLYETIVKGITGSFKQQTPSKRKLIDFFTKVSTLFKLSSAIYKGIEPYSKENFDKQVKFNRLFPKPIVSIKQTLVRFIFGFIALLLLPLHRVADKIVWNKIRQGLGDRLKVLVSGGSAMPNNIEIFLSIAGLQILNGYGLSETSPTIANRKVERNRLGTVGNIMPKTTFKIKSTDSIATNDTKKNSIMDEGVLWVKGPGLMKGYLYDPIATKEVIDEDGYFNTGDVVQLIPNTHSIFSFLSKVMFKSNESRQGFYDIAIIGRAKDTIVLLNGENISPIRVEDIVLSSTSLIDQIMVLGQNQRFLGAIAVLKPTELVNRGYITFDDLEIITNAIATNDREKINYWNNQINYEKNIKEAILSDLNPKAWGLLQPWERIGDFILSIEPFSLQNKQMTQTLKIKRHEVLIAYDKDIKLLYASKKSISK